MLAVGRKTQPLSNSNSNSRSKGSCRLSFYESPPTIDVDTEAFETYGIARLQVLRRIDVMQARGFKGERLYNEINKADLEQLFPGDNSGVVVDKDQISHYILRMAYCTTEELRRWFLTNECLLFKIRFESAKVSDVDRFLRDQKMLLRYPPISYEEKMRMKPKLLGLHNSGSTTIATAATIEYNYNTTDYYRVPFLDVLPLVSKREVYVETGHAYVSRTKILSIVEGKFRTSLSKSLSQACQMQYKWSSDTRLRSIISRLSKVAFRYGGSVGPSNAINLNNSSGQNNAQAVAQIFVDYLKGVMGHSDPKMKPAGVNKMFVSVGTKKPNTCDKTCPIANRVHKSNTQKYTIFFDTLVMEQGCWDGVCQATDKHVYYQIKDHGRCVKVGWNPPQLDTALLANALSGLSGGTSSGSKCDTCSSSSNTLTATATATAITINPQSAKKMRLAGTTASSMQVSP